MEQMETGIALRSKHRVQDQTETGIFTLQT